MTRKSEKCEFKAFLNRENKTSKTAKIKKQKGKKVLFFVPMKTFFFPATKPCFVGKQKTENRIE